LKNEEKSGTVGNLNRTTLIAAILIATIAFGAGWWIYRPSTPGPPPPIIPSETTPTETEPTPEPTTTENTTSPEIEPETTNTTDITPEMPELNETEVIVIEDLESFGRRIYEYILNGSYKDEAEGYLNKTIRITAEVTKLEIWQASGEEYFEISAGFLVEAEPRIDSKKLIFVHVQKPAVILCQVPENKEMAKNLKTGNTITLQARIVTYGSTYRNAVFNQDILYGQTLLVLQDCYVIETK